MNQVQCLAQYYFLLMCANHVGGGFDESYFRQIPNTTPSSTGMYPRTVLLEFKLLHISSRPSTLF